MAAGRFVVRGVALAAVALCGSAQANIQVGGDFWSSSGQVPSAANNMLGNTDFFAGSASTGSLIVDAGSFLQLARLSFGTNQAGNGTGLITGAGSTIELVAPYNRLHVGEWGHGQLSVTNGGLLNTRVNTSACLVPFAYCDSFVGSAAGGTGVLNIDGAGSEVRTGRTLFVGHPGLDVVNGMPTWGTPGGTTRGTVSVTNGGLLSTDRAQLGTDHWSTHATGRERNIGEVSVSGAGSRWEVVGGQTVDNANGNVFMDGAGISTAHHRNALAAINVTQGGVIDVQGSSGVFNFINLTNAGHTDMLVEGAGSKVNFSGPNGVLHVGRRVGTARMEVLAGGVVEGAYFLGIGRDESFGSMVVDGIGSRVSVTAHAEQAVQGVNRSPSVSVGNNGTGVLTVSGGALFEVSGAGQAAGNSPSITMGAGAASTGTFNILGTGTRVEVRSASVMPGGGAGEAFAAYVGVGQQGAGAMNITGGAKLILSSTVVSTDADRRSTVLNIGGATDNTVGARGLAVVRGAGSEISIDGAERFVAVGRGPSSFGQLTLANGGKLSATTINVGRAGAVGVLEMDGGLIEQTGQFTAPVAALTSTGFGVGIGGGTGIVRMNNGSTITMTNLGTGGMGMTLGGSSNFAEGDGSLTMAGGSSITVTAASGLGTFTVGRQGSGLLRMSGASTISIGDGRFYVARETGSDGTVIATGGSVINAGWVGVGRNLVNGVQSDGGTGTMVLNNATLNATDIVIGSNGFLGGTAGSINASGTITNYGIFSPGNSPGTFTINGDYVAGAGSRLILEVQDNGAGGFVTDTVLFAEGHTLDLAALNVEFRFLGATDPRAFEASGDFDIDTFLAVKTASGSTVEIDHSLLAATTFGARAESYTITSFSFSADAGVMQITVVPEPGTWMLMLLGGAAVLRSVRRTQRQRMCA